MGGEQSEPRLLGRADRLRRPPFGAEHRLPRGRPPGDHGRSRVEGRRLPATPHRAGARALGGAHDRAHHLSFRAGPAAQVRARAPGPRRAGLRLRRRLPGRELPALPGLDLRRPLRRQQLPLHHARDGLFRPRQRPWRRTGQRLQGHADALLPVLLHQRLAVPDAREPRDRPCPERRRRQRFLRRGRERQGPRCLPARRARDVPHAGGIPEGRRRGARPEGRAVTATAIRVDLQLIADMVDPSTRALDVGCGDGSLLAYLVNFKRVDARGMELSQTGVNACVANGLSVIQGDADADLRDYPDDAFDYVILSQTLQATREPREVLRQMLRVGKRAIVSFPNFAHWQVRLRLVFGGRMPETPSLPYKWYDTPNIHLCSIDDFRGLCRDMGVRIERAIVLDRNSKPISLPPLLANLLGEQAVFMLKRD
ncbi:MAG: methionine biosynthesis protein MetW [Rhodospirillales bacterium]|nr:methionine biosynthesis protein MetW [Rhodospirillales bacterium]